MWRHKPGHRSQNEILGPAIVPAAAAVVLGSTWCMTIPGLVGADTTDWRPCSRVPDANVSSAR